MGLRQLPLFHLGGPPGTVGKYPKALEAREAGSGRALEPGENIPLFLATEAIQARRPDVADSIWGVFPRELDAGVRARYNVSPVLRETIKNNPWASTEDIYAEMAGKPFGKISVAPHVTEGPLRELIASLEHETYHGETKLQNPRFARRLYQQTLAGNNPYFEQLLKDEGLVDVHPKVRYILHPEELKAQARALGLPAYEPRTAVTRDIWGRAKSDIPTLRQLLMEAYDNHAKDLEDVWKQRRIEALAKQAALQESLL